MIDPDGSGVCLRHADRFPARKSTLSGRASKNNRFPVRQRPFEFGARTYWLRRLWLKPFLIGVLFPGLSATGQGVMAISPLVLGG